MIVPQYWAEARRQHRAPGKQVTVRRFGWSDVSQDDARRHAEARVEEAMARVLAGEPLPRRERKVPYNGAEGLPIREEIVSRHGDVVVTRNSYGALCLNTPDVLFVDIDFTDPGASRWLRLAVTLIAAVVVGGYFFMHARTSTALTALAAAVIAAQFVVAAVHGIAWRLGGGPEGRAHARIARFIAAHEDWRLRQYRTPSGLRLLAMHRTFAPGDPAVQQCFAAVGADRTYVRMCARQRCFRARVSPKPWRIGIAAHMRPRPGVWPVAPEQRPKRERWIEEYELKAAGYAACRYLGERGVGRTDGKADEVRALHDALCRAEQPLPIA